MAPEKGFAKGLSLGIIMDGNGRWAKKRGLPRTAGHKRGAEVFKDEDADDAHHSSAGFARMTGAMSDHLGAPPAVLRMDPLRMAMQESVLSEDWAF